MVREGYNSITLDEDTMDRLKQIQSEEGYQTIPETIRHLLENSKVDILHKIELLMKLVDSDRDPFCFLMLEYEATRKQVEAVYDLMNKIDDDIRKGKDVHHGAFEREVYRIFPKYRGQYHFAEAIVGTLGKQRHWVAVYEYMKKNGMNPDNM